MIESCTASDTTSGDPSEPPTLPDETINGPSTVEIRPLPYPVQSVLNELSTGISSFLQTTVKTVDQSVFHLLSSQTHLEEQLVALSRALDLLSESKSCPVDLEPYLHRLSGYWQRILKVHSSLRHSQDRLNRLKHLLANS